MSEEQKETVVEEQQEQFRVVEPVAEEVQPEAQPEPQVEQPKPPMPQPQQQQERKTTRDLACGYVVGVEKNGELMFEAIGQEAGLIQLLGLHKYAEYRLGMATDGNQGYGFPMLKLQNDQMSQMLQVILNMATQNAQKNLTNK